MGDLTGDQELELVLAISKKTFEEEERRRGNDNDLIRLDEEPLQERQRQETINQIKRLYSHPTSLNTLEHNSRIPPVGIAHQTPAIGWSPHIVGSMPSSSGFPPLPQMQYSYALPGPSRPPPFGFMVPQQNTTSSSFVPPPPPLYPRLKRTSESSASHSHTAQDPFDPPSFSSSFSHLSTSSSSSTLPPVPVRKRPEPGPPPLHPRLSTVIPAPPEPAPYVNDLIVPYASIGGTPRLANGDLIDLGERNSNEDIWREFDPLFRQASPPLPAVVPTSSSTGVTRVKSTIEHSSSDVALRKSSNRQSLPTRPSSTVGTQRPKLEENKDELDVECLNAFSKREPLLHKQLDELRASRSTSTPILRFHSDVAVCLQTTVHTVQVIVYKDHTWPSKLASPPSLTLTCDTNATVEMVLVEILASLLPEDEMRGNNLPVEGYALKIFGLEEILANMSIFGKHLYVGKCLLQGRDIRLEIGRLDVKKRKHETRKVDYGKLTEQVRATSIVDPEDIFKVVLSLKPGMVEYENAVNEKNSLHVARHVSRIKQLVKLLCTLCANIQPMALHTRLQNYVTASPDRLKCARNDLIAALHGLIHVFSNSSLSQFCLAPIRKVPIVIKEVGETTEKMHVVVNSLHNLPEDWTQTIREYMVTVYLYYATEAQDVHLCSVGKTLSNDALFPYVPLQLYASFDKQLCTCPREAKFVFVVSGIAAINNNDGPTEEKRHLASTMLPLFDHTRTMRQGQFFLPLKTLSGAVLEPWGGMPMIGTGKEPILVVTLPFHDDFLVEFPVIEAEEEGVRRMKSQYDISALPALDQESLMEILEYGDIQKLTPEEGELLWQRRHYLTGLPEALPFVMAAVSDWSIAFLPSIYEALEAWDPLPPIIAVQLLLPQMSDERVRSKAVEWIEESSRESSVFLITFLPQLVECLRFEIHEDSALAQFLLRLSEREGKFAFEIYWQLQQRIDHFAEGDFGFAQRCSLLQKELLERHEKGELGEQIVRQRWLLNELDSIQNTLKDSNASDRDKMGILRQQLGLIDAELLSESVALPILPSFTCCGINVQDCGIFNSAAKPLRIVFRGINETYPIIHKSGDDMRQDALVLHLVSVMNDIWIEKQLDLKMIIFKCMPVGYRKGMAELVPDCSTLCDIQKTMGGLKGVFMDDVLHKYVARHNNSEFLYKQAHDNFIRSCAGWCVVTFLLGIGDRHNDNILVTTRGHVFHIDFGKYMGDWQMAGGFKRDRVPFVFTPEMYYLINQGKAQTPHYQVFIDYCTKAYIYLRQKSSIFTNLLKIMACSGIPGISLQSIDFVENNLRLEQTEAEAIGEFTLMLQSTLQSAFPRLNFAIHTVVQVLSGGMSNEDNNKLSFVLQLYTEQTDGRILRVSVIGYQKVTNPKKIYMYKMEVQRANSVINSTVYRSFDEFNEFYVKLRRRFPSVAFPPINRAGNGFRTNIQIVARSRQIELQRFVDFLYGLSPEIKHCDLVYTFFHSILRDNGGDMLSPDDAEEAEVLNNRRRSDLLIKLTYQQSKASLSVFVSHAKNLLETSSGSPPDSYIKAYLRPDKQKSTKQKSQIVKGSCNPTFNAELRYEHIESTAVLSMRVLELSIWYSGTILDNSKQYAYFYALKKLADAPLDKRGNRTIEEWIEMKRASGPGDFTHR